MEGLLIVWVIGIVVFGALGSWIAEQKGRGGGEGFMLGLLFGPFGVLLEALLPSQAQPAQATPRPAPKQVQYGKCRCGRSSPIDFLSYHGRCFKCIEDEQAARDAEVYEALRARRRAQFATATQALHTGITRLWEGLVLPEWAQPIKWGLMGAAGVLSICYVVYHWL